MAHKIKNKFVRFLVVIGILLVAILFQGFLIMFFWNLSIGQIFNKPIDLSQAIFLSFLIGTLFGAGYGMNKMFRGKR